MNNKVNTRYLALETLLDVHRNGTPAHLVIRDVLENYSYLPREEKAFYQRLCEGTLEYRLQLDYVLNQFSKTPVNKMKPVVREILRLAVYQIFYMDAVPDSAAVNEAVKLAVRKGFGSLRGFINGVLRAVIRGRESIKWPDRDKEPARYIEITYAIPAFLAERWIADYGIERTESMAKYFLSAQPLTVRVRNLGTDANAGVIAKSPDHIDTPSTASEGANTIVDANTWVDIKHIPGTSAAHLTFKGSITDLPAYADGSIVVQDLSSQLAVMAAGIQTGDTVIDLCAAPGGKTMYAADLTGPTGTVYSRDVSEYKLDRIEENLERCGIENVIVQLADATELDEEMAGKADVVIADVPCTGYGVIGKKPDIKYNASEEKEKSLHELQRQILTQAVALVKPGGTLLFSTCTFGNQENIETARWLAETYGLTFESLDQYLPAFAQNETTSQGYREILPGELMSGEFGCDGFFFARLKK